MKKKYIFIFVLMSIFQYQSIYSLDMSMENRFKCAGCAAKISAVTLLYENEYEKSYNYLKSIEIPIGIPFIYKEILYDYKQSAMEMYIEKKEYTSISGIAKKGLSGLIDGLTLNIPGMFEHFKDGYNEIVKKQWPESIRIKIDKVVESYKRVFKAMNELGFSDDGLYLLTKLNAYHNLDLGNHIALKIERGEDYPDPD